MHMQANMPLLKLFHLSQDDRHRPHVVCQTEQKLKEFIYRIIVQDATYYFSRTLDCVVCEVAMRLRIVALPFCLLLFADVRNIHIYLDASPVF